MEKLKERLTILLSKEKLLNKPHGGDTNILKNLKDMPKQIHLTSSMSHS